MASYLKGIKTQVTAEWKNPAQNFPNPCLHLTRRHQHITQLPNNTFTMNLANATTINTRSVPAKVSWKCDTDKKYTLILHDWGPIPVSPQGFKYLHWMRVNIACSNGIASVTSPSSLDSSQATGGKDLGRTYMANETFGGYLTPANGAVTPHNYGFFVYEQASDIAANQSQIAALKSLQSSFSISQDKILAQFSQIQNKNPVAVTWANIRLHSWTAYQTICSKVGNGGSGSTDERD